MYHYGPGDWRSHTHTTSMPNQPHSSSMSNPESIGGAHHMMRPRPAYPVMTDARPQPRYTPSGDGAFSRVQEPYANQPPVPYGLAGPSSDRQYGKISCASDGRFAPEGFKDASATHKPGTQQLAQRGKPRSADDSLEESKEVTGNKNQRKKRSSEEQLRRNEAEKKRIRKAADTIDLLRSELVLHSGMMQHPGCSPCDMSKQAILELSLQQLAKLRQYCTKSKKPAEVV